MLMQKPMLSRMKRLMLMLMLLLTHYAEQRKEGESDAHSRAYASEKANGK